MKCQSFSVVDVKRLVSNRLQFDICQECQINCQNVDYNVISVKNMDPTVEESIKAGI